MRLNTMQVADRLGVKRDFIATLMRRGELHDLGVRRNGAKRHQFQFDSHEVEALAAERARLLAAAVTIDGGSVPPGTASSGGVVTRIARLEETLARIEKRVDELFAVWR